MFFEARELVRSKEETLVVTEEALNKCQDDYGVCAIQ